jgi:hypothetical protein
MVMFHADIPYLVAQQRGEVQSTLLGEFTEDADDMNGVDIDAAINAVKERLEPLATIRTDLVI